MLKTELPSYFSGMKVILQVFFHIELVSRIVLEIITTFVTEMVLSNQPTKYFLQNNDVVRSASEF